MSKKALILATLSFLLLFSLSALPAISLEEALQLGRTNNLSLTSTALDVNTAKRDVETSWNLFIPTLSLTLSNAGGGPIYTGPAKAQNQGLSVSLAVSLTLNPAVKSQMDSYRSLSDTTGDLRAGKGRGGEDHYQTVLLFVDGRAEHQCTTGQS
jgi:outer membrane protein TolC